MYHGNFLLIEHVNFFYISNVSCMTIKVKLKETIIDNNFFPPRCGFLFFVDGEVRKTN